MKLNFTLAVALSFSLVASSASARVGASEKLQWAPNGLTKSTAHASREGDSTAGNASGKSTSKPKAAAAKNDRFIDPDGTDPGDTTAMVIARIKGIDIRRVTRPAVAADKDIYGTGGEAALNGLLMQPAIAVENADKAIRALWSQPLTKTQQQLNSFNSAVTARVVAPPLLLRDGYQALNGVAGGWVEWAARVDEGDDFGAGAVAPVVGTVMAAEGLASLPQLGRAAVAKGLVKGDLALPANADTLNPFNWRLDWFEGAADEMAMAIGPPIKGLKYVGPKQLLKSNRGLGPLRWTNVDVEPPSLGHGNSLEATGPHDVYAIRALDDQTLPGGGQVKAGQVLHFGETGRGYEVRGDEWVRKFQADYGIESEVQHLQTVEGKAAARAGETRRIDIYEKVYGRKPGFTDAKGEWVETQKTRH